jgi:Outer membrane protein beta-barrel domain
MRFIFSCLLLVTSHLALSQNTESFGVFGGVNVPFTIDQGLNKDARFHGKGVVRGTPVGVYYGYDKSGYGFALTPNYVMLGQTFKIKNTTGGDVGFRYVKTNYFAIPVALKIHINDLSFFRLSLVAALSPSILISGQETMTHDATKLKYPSGVSVPTDPGYVVSYDGVFVPKVDNQVYVSKDKFSIFQLFGSLGLRSDFDLNDNWSINYDGRVNFGIFDSRKASYIQQLKTPSGPADVNGNPGAPDLYGPRRDVYISLEIGFCRIIQTKEKFHTKSSGRSITIQKDIPKPRNKKPRR